MEKPNRLFINDCWWTVIEDGSLTEEKNWGANDPSSLTIDIDPSLAPDRWKLTLYHEIIHAMLVDSRYQNEEDLCNILSHQLKSFLDNNFGALQLLIKEN